MNGTYDCSDTSQTSQCRLLSLPQEILDKVAIYVLERSYLMNRNPSSQSEGKPFTPASLAILRTSRVLSKSALRALYTHSIIRYKICFTDFIERWPDINCYTLDFIQVVEFEINEAWARKTFDNCTLPPEESKDQFMLELGALFTGRATPLVEFEDQAVLSGGGKLNEWAVPHMGLQDRSVLAAFQGSQVLRKRCQIRLVVPGGELVSKLNESWCRAFEKFAGFETLVAEMTTSTDKIISRCNVNDFLRGGDLNLEALAREWESSLGPWIFRQALSDGQRYWTRSVEFSPRKFQVESVRVKGSQSLKDLDILMKRLKSSRYRLE